MYHVINSLSFNWLSGEKNATATTFLIFFCSFGGCQFPTYCASKSHYRFDFYTSPAEFNAKVGEGYSVHVYLVALLVVFNRPFLLLLFR